MASLQNRSPLVVTVTRKPDLKREFRFDQPEKADEYMAALKAQAALAGKTIEVKLAQLDTSWEVRIRQRGYKAVNITAGSLADAETLVKGVESDRAQSLVIDYTKAHHVSFAELMVMHIDKHKRPKSFGHDFYKVAAWLRDSGLQGVSMLAAFQAEREAAGKPLPALKFRIAEEMENLEWIHKKFAHVEAQDINDYVDIEDVRVPHLAHPKTRGLWQQTLGDVVVDGLGAHAQEVGRVGLQHRHERGAALGLGWGDVGHEGLRVSIPSGSEPCLSGPLGEEVGCR